MADLQADVGRDGEAPGLGADMSMEEHICEIHGCEMEWIEDVDGSAEWFCQMCWDDEEYRQRRMEDE